MEEKKMNLYEKIKKVIEETGYIPKKGRNTIQKYDYVQESDVVNTLRAPMAKYGLILIPTTKEVKWLEGVKTRSGGTMSRVEVSMLYKLINTENPKEFEEIMVTGEGMDSGDKAINKAITASKKYALLLLFLLPTGDDPEKDESVDIETKVITVTTKEKVKDLPLDKREKIMKAFAQIEFDKIEPFLKGRNVADLTVEEAREIFKEAKK